MQCSQTPEAMLMHVNVENVSLCFVAFISWSCSFQLLKIDIRKFFLSSMKKLFLEGLLFQGFYYNTRKLSTDSRERIVSFQVSLCIFSYIIMQK